MVDAGLNFSSVAWPLAELAGSDPVEYRFQPAVPGLPVEPPSNWRSFRIAAAGRTKPWTATKPQAFWRSLGELAPRAEADQGKLALGFRDFVRRFGPIAEPISDELVTDTGTWLTASCYFAEIAKAWEPEDLTTGISRLSANRTRRDTARQWLQFVLPAAMNDSGLVFDAESRIVLQARSLYAFMALSAHSALQRGAAMRRCGHCQFWFEPSRADTLYCSNACRVAHHVARTRPERAVRRPHIQARKKVRRRG